MNSGPMVAPNESYLILTCNHNDPNNVGYIGFRKPGGGWAKVISPGEKTNVSSAQRSTGLSLDGKYLFLVRGGRSGGRHRVATDFNDELGKTALGE